MSSSAVSGPLPEGTLLAGKYRLARLLGAGGMGAVYEARPIAACYTRGGEVRAVVTFSGSGRVTGVALRAHHVTETARERVELCAELQLRHATVPPFAAPSFTARRVFTLGTQDLPPSGT